MAILLELASYKALTDELSQQLHRLKRKMSSMDSDVIGECATQKRYTKVPRSNCPESPVAVCFLIINTLLNETMHITHDDKPSVPCKLIRDRHQLKRVETGNKICDYHLPRRWQSKRCNSYVGRESTSFVSNSNRVAMPSAPETAPHMSSGDRHLSQSWKNALDNAHSSRLSNVMQILRLNKNDCRDGKGSSTDEEDSTENVFTKARGLAMKESQSCPQIEGVIFPVSSEEVLGAILLDWTIFACLKRVSSYSNEEWPEQGAQKAESSGRNL